ncbi:DUF2808 domain-containing protein (plasmid) [Acaryochloris sp. CCMEE 5410]|nr:DUF2808 domain-containing protein [Acaryochloris sp. CCMEE 5410]
MKMSKSLHKRLMGTSLLLLGVVAPSIMLASPSTAVQFPDGRTAFNSPPRLIEAESSYTQQNVPSTYYFTLKIPANAGEPLKAIKIAQRENVETISYGGNSTRAFQGSRWARGTQFSLTPVGGSTEPGAMTVVFDSPVQPGETITVALKAKNNPTFGGIYHFGVTAYPAGDKSIGQFLGYARLSFYAD